MKYAILIFTGLTPKRHTVNSFKTAAVTRYPQAEIVTCCHKSDKSDNAFNDLKVRPGGTPTKQLMVYAIFDPSCSAMTKKERKVEVEKNLPGYNVTFACCYEKDAYVPSREKGFRTVESVHEELGLGIAA